MLPMSWNLNVRHLQLKLIKLEMKSYKDKLGWEEEEALGWLDNNSADKSNNYLSCLTVCLSHVKKNMEIIEQ